MYFRSLQIFRGFAALAVVLFHINHYATEGFFKDPNTIFRWCGPVFSHGCWFFFVVSGFLMGYLVDSGYRHFLSRRMIRIYSTFWAVVALVFVGKWILLGVKPFGLKTGVPMTLLPFGRYVIKGLNTDYPLTVEWTLVYEIVFYLVCAVFANRWMRRYFLPFLVAWLAVLMVMPFLYAYVGLRAVQNDHWALTAEPYFHAIKDYQLPLWNEMFLSPFNAMFVVGGIGFYIFKRLPALSWHWPVASLVPAAFLYYFSEMLFTYGWMQRFAAYTGMDWTILKLLLHSTGFLMIIFAFSAWERGKGKPVRKNALEHFGDYSYALYLIHVPVITTLFYIVNPEKVNHSGLCLLALLLAVTAGSLVGAADMAMQDGLKWAQNRLWAAIARAFAKCKSQRAEEAQMGVPAVPAADGVPAAGE